MYYELKVDQSVGKYQLKDTLGAYLEDVEYRIAELHASEKDMDFSPEYFEWLWDNGLI
jgi:hypothetical protein